MSDLRTFLLSVTLISEALATRDKELLAKRPGFIGVINNPCSHELGKADVLLVERVPNDLRLLLRSENCVHFPEETHSFGIFLMIYSIDSPDSQPEVILKYNHTLSSEACSALVKILMNYKHYGNLKGIEDVIRGHYVNLGYVQLEYDRPQNPDKVCCAHYSGALTNLFPYYAAGAMFAFEVRADDYMRPPSMFVGDLPSNYARFTIKTTTEETPYEDHTGLLMDEEDKELLASLNRIMTEQTVLRLKLHRQQAVRYAKLLDDRPETASCDKNKFVLSMLKTVLLNYEMLVDPKALSEEE